MRDREINEEAAKVMPQARLASTTNGPTTTMASGLVILEIPFLN
jgi:hypothetical protein